MSRSRTRSLFTLLAAQVLLLAFLPARAGAAAPVETDTYAATVQVDLANDQVQGWGWIANSTVTLSIWQDATNLDAAAVFVDDIQVDGSKQFSASFRSDGYDLPLVTGMGFAVTGDVLMWDPNTQQDEVTPVTKVLTDTFVEITSFDVDNDVLSGVHATPGGFHVCLGSDWAGYGSGCGFADQPGTGLTVLGDGTWTLDASMLGIDVAPGITQTQAGGQDLNGDVVGSDARSIPWPHLYVHHPYGVQAQGFFEPADEGFQVSMTATWPGEGPTELAGTVGADGNAEFALEGRALEPGTYLEFTGPRPALLAGTEDVTRTMTITPPALTGVDLSTSSVAGTAAPSSNVMLYPIESAATDWVRRHAVADPSGAFGAQFSVAGDEPPMEDSTVAMTAEGAVMVEEYDADFDVTNIWQPNTVYEPFVGVQPDTDLSDGQSVTVFGDGFPPGDLQLIQCLDTALEGDCDVGTLQGPATMSGEGFQLEFSVSRYISTPNSSWVDCGADPGRCVIVAFHGNGEVSAKAPISFLPPLDLTLWVSPTVTVNSASGRATVSGTISCSSPGWASVSGDLWQRAGRKGIGQGTFAIGVGCDGVHAASWSAILTPVGVPNLPFAKGVAELDVRVAMDRYGDHAEAGWHGNVNVAVPKQPKPPR
jgi:hypothetical protein